jgi:hypothetical protein
LRHGILTGGYQLSCTVDTHFLNELDRRQSGQGFQLLEEYGTAHGKFLHKIIYYQVTVIHVLLHQFYKFIHKLTVVGRHCRRFIRLRIILDITDTLFIGNSCNRSCLHQVLAVQSLQFLPLGKQVLYTCF